jgi:hypothetical protein
MECALSDLSNFIDRRHEVPVVSLTGVCCCAVEYDSFGGTPSQYEDNQGGVILG